MQRIADRLLTASGQASFTGGVAAHTPDQAARRLLGRHGRALQQRQPGQPRTITQLRNDEVTGGYYAWWYGKRRAFLVALRDYIHARWATQPAGPLQRLR